MQNFEFFLTNWFTLFIASERIKIFFFISNVSSTILYYIIRSIQIKHLHVFNPCLYHCTIYENSFFLLII